MLFTLHQWLELIAGPALGWAVCYLVTSGVCTMEDRKIRRYSELDKRLEEIRKMPD